MPHNICANRKKVCSFLKEHYLITAIIGYVFVVVLFAIINYLMFLYNSTSYLISEQLNKHIQRYDFLDPNIDLAGFHKDTKDAMPITIDGFIEQVKPSFDSLQAVNDSLSFTQTALNNCTERWDSLSRTASAMRDDSVKRVRERLLSVYQERIDSLSQYMEGKDSTEMIIAGKYVEMAQLQYEYAKKNAKVQSMIVEYWGSFIPDSLSHRIRRCNEDYIWLAMEVQKFEQSRRDVSTRIRNASISFHRNRLDAVSFLDFLYYSICVSTTVSFGDIAPNNGSTRFVAILELLFCLVIVGYIVDRIIKKREE